MAGGAPFGFGVCQGADRRTRSVPTRGACGAYRSRYGRALARQVDWAGRRSGFSYKRGDQANHAPHQLHDSAYCESALLTRTRSSCMVYLMFQQGVSETVWGELLPINMLKDVAKAIKEVWRCRRAPCRGGWTSTQSPWPLPQNQSAPPCRLRPRSGGISSPCRCRPRPAAVRAVRTMLLVHPLQGLGPASLPCGLKPTIRLRSNVAALLGGTVPSGDCQGGAPAVAGLAVVRINLQDAVKTLLGGRSPLSLARELPLRNGATLV